MAVKIDRAESEKEFKRVREILFSHLEVVDGSEEGRVVRPVRDHSKVWKDKFNKMFDSAQ